MIVLTGAAGFIGSVILEKLNQYGYTDIYLFEEMIYGQYHNLVGKKFSKIFQTHEIDQLDRTPEFVIHVGANSNTLQSNWDQTYRTNILSTRQWQKYCQENDIPMIFTSSAAVYGNGNGPCNLYAFSKLASENELGNACVLRLFNVYGPNESHKGRMASTIYHWYQQLTETGVLRIFENSNDYYRDFIYVDDVADTILSLIKNFRSGVYDLGTGWSQSFEEIADIIIEEIGGEKQYIPMPDDLKLQYQVNTQAGIMAENLSKNTLDAKIGIEKYIKKLKTL